jgi:5-methylthioadenosine/S-adenosylhomocysteine deaminase
MNEMILKYKRWYSVILGSFMLSVIAGSFCALALAAPSKTLIRGAALIFIMDSTIGTGELGIV